MLSAERLVGLLAEPERRRVAAALILSSGSLDDVVERSGLDARDAVDALERLTSAGLVEQGSDGTFILLEEAFKAAARAATPLATLNGEQEPATDDDIIVSRSIVDGRLVHLPRKRSKRLPVLDRLSQEFEPGRHYSEREVNQLLWTFDNDVATLRRYLVDERFLDREDGTYWRSGGSVET